MGAPLVLVHGGAHGAWCWRPTIAELATPSLAVDLQPQSIRGGPLRNVRPPELADLTISDWSAQVLEEAKGAGWERFVLVGHSLGGLTIADVARRAPERVAHLVYVSASVPPEGGTVLDMLPPEVSEEVTAGLGDDVTRGMFCNDMDEEQARYVLDRIGLEVESVVTEPVTRVGIPRSLPATYIRLGRDKALPPETQDECIARLRTTFSAVEVAHIDAGHDVMVSQPAKLAKTLDRIAASAS